MGDYLTASEQGGYRRSSCLESMPGNLRLRPWLARAYCLLRMVNLIARYQVAKLANLNRLDTVAGEGV